MNIENDKDLQDGLNNDEYPLKPLIGGDEQEGLPSIQEKQERQKDGNNEPNNEEMPSPKAEIQNPHIKTIIKKIEDGDLGGDKVDIDFTRGITKDSTTIQPKDEYLEN